MTALHLIAPTRASRYNLFVSTTNLGERSSPRKPVRRGVIGILSRDETYLMVRRADCVPKGGCWCFPGGHVEPGETPRLAVTRELAEELGIVVTPTRRLGAVQVRDSRHVLAVWCVEHVGGDFELAEKEIAEMRWVSLLEIRAIAPGLASNTLVLEMLQRQLLGTLM